MKTRTRSAMALGSASTGSLKVIRHPRQARALTLVLQLQESDIGIIQLNGHGAVDRVAYIRSEVKSAAIDRDPVA